MALKSYHSRMIDALEKYSLPDPPPGTLEDLQYVASEERYEISKEK